MAKKFVSPGVFTSEIDQSFLAQGVADIGAAVIGRTAKGPAFTPTVVPDYQSFVDRFGDVDPEMSVPYAAKNYLKNANGLTVVRTLGFRDGQSGVKNSWAENVIGLVDASGVMLAEVHYPTNVTATLSGTGAVFSLKFQQGSTVLYTGSVSFISGAPTYVGTALNSDPTMVSTYGHYLYKNFAWAHPGVSSSYATASLSGSTTASFDYDYTGSQTPWIHSQPIGGNSFPLFRFWTKSHGAASTDEIKIAIENVRTSLNTSITRFGQFDVIVRSFTDTDQNAQVLESFPGCDLDPSSINYVARRIGDKYEVWDTTQRKFFGRGTYPSNSRYVRLEISTTAASAPEAVPWGFYGFPENGTTASGSNSLADLPYISNNLNTAGNVVPSTLFGVNFSKTGITARLKALMDPSVAAQFTGSDFSLAYVSSGSVVAGVQSYNYSQNTASLVWPAVPGTASVNGFALPFFGGFDGFDMTVADPLALSDGAAASNIGVVSLKAAVSNISNPDAFDMNILAVPGCVADQVTDYARQVCNDRADCIFIMDITGSSVAGAISALGARGIDDNYSACYYPDLILNDTTNTRYIQVKPSVAVLAAFAFSDRVGQVFFAPAGMNRGGLGQFGIVDVADRLTFDDRDSLYSNKINPIATFPKEGIVVFGQKTLQARQSALDRVNVRRLLIFAKKTIASAAKLLLFDPSDPTTWQRFINAVNPILEKIRRNQGLVRFKVVMDSTVNTPDVIDRNEMVGKIFLQPTKAAEFIDLQFVISPSGVVFEE